MPCFNIHVKNKCRKKIQRSNLVLLYIIDILFMFKVWKFNNAIEVEATFYYRSELDITLCW